MNESFASLITYFSLHIIINFEYNRIFVNTVAYFRYFLYNFKIKNSNETTWCVINELFAFTTKLF